jgi:hypothetical protein
MIRILAASLFAFVAASVSLSADAQAPSTTPPVRVRGTVEKLQNNVMTVKQRSGSSVDIKLADNYTVIGVQKAKIEDLAPGKYIGTTTLGERNGSLVAIEVHIFTEAMRGTGEGHYPWDLKPDSMMTNANVAEVKSFGSNRTLKVQYKGGEKQVLVTPTTSIVSFVPAERVELAPGSKIFCVAQRKPDGSLGAARVNIGLNGVIPPM